jgi:hypothetical protein
VERDSEYRAAVLLSLPDFGEGRALSSSLAALADPTPLPSPNTGREKEGGVLAF